MTFRKIAVRQEPANPVGPAPSTASPLSVIPRPRPSYARPSTGPAQPLPLRVKPESNLGDDGRVRLPLHDLLRAGYEFGVQKTRGRPEPQPAIDARHRVNETMAEARYDMPYGRGNDEKNLRETGGESGRRCKAGEHLYHSIKKTKGPLGPGGESALAVKQQAGVCRDHADRFTHHYWKRMQPGEEVLPINNKRDKHTWGTVLAREDQGDATKGRTGDPWKWGPATETVHSSSQMQKPTIEYAYVRGEKQLWMNEEAEARANFEESGEFEESLQKLDATGFAYLNIWQPESTVSKAFAQESAQALGIETPADPMLAYVEDSTQDGKGEQVLKGVNPPEQMPKVDALLEDAKERVCRLGSSPEWAARDAPFVVAYAGRLDVPLGA
jgi:hypothetical protein